MSSSITPCYEDLNKGRRSIYAAVTLPHTTGSVETSCSARRQQLSGGGRSGRRGHPSGEGDYCCWRMGRGERERGEQERERERETDRQTDRQTDSRQTDRQTGRQTDREREREGERAKASESKRKQAKASESKRKQAKAIVAWVLANWGT